MKLRLLVSWKESCGKLSILKSRDITLPTKVCIVKTMIFPVVHVWEMMLIVLSCVLTSCDPMDCSPPGSSVHGIFQAKYWSGLPFSSSRGSSWPGIESTSLVSPIGRQILYPGSCSPRDSQKSSPAPQFKGGWAAKNWCFWTVVLEKTLESHLDCKEIKPANPKGNQPWIFIGRTVADAEAPILWPPDWRRTDLATTLVKNWLIGKDWCWERLKAKEESSRGWDGWVALATQRTWIRANSGRKWRIGEPGVLQSMGSRKVRHNLAATEQQQWGGGGRKFDIHWMQYNG